MHVEITSDFNSSTFNKAFEAQFFSKAQGPR
ncbi:MAG: hypothetical protein ACI9H8_001253 [Lysobacterales bacterium]|jgi:hypothetical protein